MKTAEVCLNGKDWLTVNQNSVDFIYEDEMKAFVIIVDELAELTQPTGLKTSEGKEEDQMREEIIMILRSIAQLGRSSGMHALLATQRSNSVIIPTVLRSNPLEINTLVEVVE